MNNKEKLIEAFRHDGEFQQKLLTCDEKAAAVSLAMEKVPGITEDEVMECVKELLNLLIQSQTSFLEEEEQGVEVTLKSDTVTTATTVTTITAAASSYAFI